MKFILVVATIFSTLKKVFDAHKKKNSNTHWNT